VGKTALIAGSTGLVGGLCLKLLLDHPAYERVVAVVRSGQGISHPKYFERIVSFDDLGNVPMVEAQEAFCALGTTRKKAGSKDAFYRVDHDYVANFAYWARGGGTELFSLVSSVGANPNSGNFYLATKGDVEQAIKEQHFPRVDVFRPGQLLGHRNEVRLVEQIGDVVFKVVKPLLAGPLRQYRAIEASSVAAAMVAMAQQEGPGFRTYVYDQILEASRLLRE